MEREELLSEALNLKDEYLETKLKILGYQDTESVKKSLDSSAGYHVLGKIGYDLEHFINPVKKSLEIDEESQAEIEACKKETEDEKMFIENQEDFLNRVRSIYEDFGLNMKEKISAEDWELYSRTVQNTANLLIDLTKVPEESDLAQKSRLEQEDVVSELIDSQDFAKACQIEDSFMIEEFEKFKGIAKKYGYDDEKVRETSCAVELAELVRQSENIASKKGKYVRSFEKYDEFLRTLNDKVIIKGKNDTDKVEKNVNKGEDGTDR